MKLFIALVIIISISIGIKAQNIEFEIADPQSTLQGALMGDNEFADVDGDGDQDLFVCGRIDGWVSSNASTLYLNDGLGNFIADDNAVFSNVEFVAAGFNDVDADGDQDLVLTGIGQSSVLKAELYLNDGSGNFELMIGLPFTPCKNASLDFGDVDGDGDDDLLLSGEGTDGFFTKLYKNNGNAQFSEFFDAAFMQENFVNIEFADINGDNDLDVIGIGFDASEDLITRLYLNDGLGQYELSESGIDPLDSSFTTGDLDQDGDVDVILNGIDSNGNIKSNLYLNDGTGLFDLFSGTDVFTKVFAGQTLFHDLDGDNDLDILLSGSSDGGLGGELGIVSNVYENLGDNNYILADSLAGSYFSNNAIGDINGDGLADLILSGTTVGSPNFKTWIYMNTTEVSVGVEGLSAVNFDVFPNPSNGRFTVQLENAKNASIEIYNMTGEMMFQKRAIISGIQSFETDLSNGIYNLILRDDRSIGTKRIVVVK